MKFNILKSYNARVTAQVINTLCHIDIAIRIPSDVWNLMTQMQKTAVINDLEAKLNNFTVMGGEERGD